MTVDIQKSGSSTLRPAEDVENHSADLTPAKKQLVVVNFCGADDSDDPRNWTKTRKWLIVSTLALLAFLTPLASSIIAPGVEQVMDDFKTKLPVLSALIVSIFVLGYATGPLVFAPLSELYGRSVIYHASTFIFFVTSIICAVSVNAPMLIVFRFLQGLGGSCVLSNGGGTIVDLFKQEERGTAIAIWATGPVFGPVVGAICGGYLSQYASWRWSFWLVVIFAGLVQVSMVFVLRETHGPTILKKRARKAQKADLEKQYQLEDGANHSPQRALAHAIVRPARMMLIPIILLLSIYQSVCYGYLYLLYTTFPEIFQSQYGFSVGSTGLTYLGLGIGMIVGQTIFGLCSDRSLVKLAKGQEKKPEYRLPPMIAGGALIPVGLFVYGWSAQYSVHWILPILGTAIIGAGLVNVFAAASTYLVDAFSAYASSALAAAAVSRSLVGAFLPLAGPSMYRAIGLGWGNSLLAFIAVAFIPVPWLFFVYGERIRTSPRWQVRL